MILGVTKMQINLICSESQKKIITAMIEANGLRISSNSRVTLLEKGFDQPKQGISVLFDQESLSDLFDFLGALSPKSDTNKAVIVGRQQDSEKYEVISLEEVSCFEAEGNYTYCLAGSLRLRIKSKIYELEASLLDKGFIRINKSMIVNIMSVAEIVPWFGSRLLLKLKNNREVEVSRNYVKSFKEYLEL